jgi:hypothetical protein
MPRFFADHARFICPLFGLLLDDICTTDTLIFNQGKPEHSYGRVNANLSPAKGPWFSARKPAGGGAIARAV